MTSPRPTRCICEAFYRIACPVPAHSQAAWAKSFTPTPWVSRYTR